MWSAPADSVLSLNVWLSAVQFGWKTTLVSLPFGRWLFIRVYYYYFYTFFSVFDAKKIRNVWIKERGKRQAGIRMASLEYLLDSMRFHIGHKHSVFIVYHFGILFAFYFNLNCFAGDVLRSKCGWKILRIDNERFPFLFLVSNYRLYHCCHWRCCCFCRNSLYFFIEFHWLLFDGAKRANFNTTEANEWIEWRPNVKAIRKEHWMFEKGKNRVIRMQFAHKRHQDVYRMHSTDTVASNATESDTSIATASRG